MEQENIPAGKKDKAMIYIIIIIVLFLGYFLIFANKQADEPANLENNLEEQMENTNQDSQQANELKIEVLQEGSGDQVTKAGDRIAVHYTGTLLDGTKFDSSVDRGQPFVFILGAGQVIAGWDQGLLDMKVGEKRQLTIPASLGYGDQGAGGIIKPGDTLVFETELMAIE